MFLSCWHPIDSYAKFLQLENAFDQRTDDGLQAAFNSIFPIVSHNGYARLEFVHYTLGEAFVRYS